MHGPVCKRIFVRGISVIEEIVVLQCVTFFMVMVLAFDSRARFRISVLRNLPMILVRRSLTDEQN